MSTLLFKNNLDGTTDVVSGGINTLKINADKTLATATPSNTMSGNNLATVGQIPSLVVTSISGLLAADIGSVYLRTDGAVGSTMYVKESGTGNTGWYAK
jgi:hypothetical protein